MTTDIESRVIAIAENVLKAKHITPDSSFTNDLGADSLDSVELMMAFEAEFNINIPDEDATKIATVRDAVNYVKTKMSE